LGQFSSHFCIQANYPAAITDLAISALTCESDFTSGDRSSVLIRFMLSHLVLIAANTTRGERAVLEGTVVLYYQSLSFLINMVGIYKVDRNEVGDDVFTLWNLNTTNN
jgi:hypothetical protein